MNPGLSGSKAVALLSLSHSVLQNYRKTRQKGWEAWVVCYRTVSATGHCWPVNSVCSRRQGKLKVGGARGAGAGGWAGRRAGPEGGACRGWWAWGGQMEKPWIAQPVE